MTTVAEKKRTAVAAKQWAEKARRLGTLKNFHIAGVVALGLVNLYLLAHMAFAWRAANSENAAALADQTVADEDGGDCETAARGAGREAGAGDQRCRQVL